MIEKIAQREGLGDLLAEDMATVGGEDRRRRLDLRRAHQGPGLPDARAAVQARPGHRLCRLAHRRGPLPLAARHRAEERRPRTALIAAGNGGLRRPGRARARPARGPRAGQGARRSRSTRSRPWCTNCLTMCTFPGWSIARADRHGATPPPAGTCSEYELIKVGERALNLARVFNMREGSTVEDDHLSERSYRPDRATARWPTAASTARSCARPCTPTMA